MAKGLFGKMKDEGKKSARGSDKKSARGGCKK